MAYDGFYSGLSSRQAVSEILTQAQRVRDQIAAEVEAFDPKYDAALAAVAEANVVLDQVTILANQASQDSALAISSAAQARVSETAALASQVAALASETASKASEVAAKASQDASKVSELAAKASELAAKASETSALAYQVAAKVSQDAAKVSETNSKTSETNSKASEVASKTSETNSKSSETASASSATAASGSAAAALASKNAAKVSQDAAKVSEDAAKTAVEDASNAGLQLGMVMWGSRTQPFSGFALDDGQELSRATYPSFAALLDSGLLPVVTQESWDLSPANRGYFVAVSSPGMFRMRDLNGISPGSIVGSGGAFLRGGATTSRNLIADSIRVQRASWEVGAGFRGSATDAGEVSGALADTLITSNSGRIGPTATSSYLRTLTIGTGSETAPKYARGAWMTRLFGIITPLGTAEANSLATSYAALSAKIEGYEGRVAALEYTFGGDTWLTYTNGGTVSASPTTSGLRIKDLHMFARCEVSEHGFVPTDIVDFGPANIYGSINGVSYGHRMEIIPGNRARATIGDGGITIISKEPIPKLRVLTPANWRLSLAGKAS